MRILAGLISLGRFFFGVAFIAEPTLMERAWIGKQARLPGTQLLARAVGARDLALGGGGLRRGRLRRHVEGQPGHSTPGAQRRARDRRRVLGTVSDRGSRARSLWTRGAAPLAHAPRHEGRRRP